MRNRRVPIFSVIFIAAAIFVAAYLRHAATRLPAQQASAPMQSSAPVESSDAVAGAAPGQPVESVSTGDERPATAPIVIRANFDATSDEPPAQLFFRYNGVDSHYGALAHTRTDRLNQVSYVDTLHCEVVHVSGGKGICLTADRGVFTTYAALLFDAETFQVTARIPLDGIPSRCRMSIDGKLAALTIFVSGHGYATLDFSTQTLLIDVESGTVLADIEKDFTVTRAGKPFKNEDFNFWGVTFTSDVKNFYATLSTEGKHFLVRGDIAGRTATVEHENVECPSVSPDDSRVAYKKRFMRGSRILWQLHVLDLKTRKETPLSEKRSIDDQLEWLDTHTVLYSVPAGNASGASTEVWMAPADGGAEPKLFLANAYSPAVARHKAQLGE